MMNGTPHSTGPDKTLSSSMATSSVVRLLWETGDLQLRIRIHLRGRARL